MRKPRKLVVMLTATAAILLASSVAWKADAQTAPGTIVEVVLKPCDPGVPRNQCGISIHVVQGSATFNGQAIQTGQVLSVNGNGVMTQSNQANSILNFASAGNTTGSIGLGGGGSGTTGSLGANGGTNSGSTPTGGTNAASTGTGTGLTGGYGGSSGGSSVVTSNSPTNSVSMH